LTTYKKLRKAPPECPNCGSKLSTRMRHFSERCHCGQKLRGYDKLLRDEKPADEVDEVLALDAPASALADILEQRLGERFSDRSDPATGLEGGQGGAAGGSPLSNASDRVQQAYTSPQCPSCKDQLQTGADGASTCPSCGYAAAANFDGGQQAGGGEGGGGVKAGNRPGYLRVPGGPFDTQEAGKPGQIRLKFNGNMMFEMDSQGARIEHAVGNAQSVMAHRLQALGYNKDRVMCSLIEWLFLEAQPGEELIWNLVDGSRMILDRNGYRKHVESYYDQ